ncbi:hypothetical protein D3C78_1170260 [compost metagenome]
MLQIDTGTASHASFQVGYVVAKDSPSNSRQIKRKIHTNPKRSPFVPSDFVASGSAATYAVAASSPGATATEVDLRLMSTRCDLASNHRRLNSMGDWQGPVVANHEEARASGPAIRIERVGHPAREKQDEYADDSQIYLYGRPAASGRPMPFSSATMGRSLPVA